MIDASARPACSPAPARTPPALQHWLVQFRLDLLQSVLCCDSRTTRPASPAERLVRILRLCRPTTAHRVPAAGHRVAAAGVPGPGRDGRFELQDRVTLEKHVQIMWGRARPCKSCGSRRGPTVTVAARWRRRPSHSSVADERAAGVQRRLNDKQAEAEEVQRSRPPRQLWSKALQSQRTRCESGDRAWLDRSSRPAPGHAKASKPLSRTCQPRDDTSAQRHRRSLTPSPALATRQLSRRRLRDTFTLDPRPSIAAQA